MSQTSAFKSLALVEALANAGASTVNRAFAPQNLQEAKRLKTLGSLRRH
ncbi:hypothetical protein HMPREF9004_0064 [Schaalia cardiffensis F0333]|uniref:Uncharacterized protein n=1 Tax=Schaalia cardiffensis F0333 TaxID=888050 RepID=N6W9B2_9ACTO|nr:hypothetical protein HMPREF9004_0064 [Schaalia cardiffensis F0333]